MVALNWGDPHETGGQVAFLKARNELLTLGMQAGCLGIWEWEPATGCFMIHPVLTGMLGDGAASRVLGIKQWLQRIHPRDRRRVERALSRFLQGKESLYQHCHRMLHQEGMVLYVLSRARVVERTDGRPARIVGVEIDITDALLARQHE